MIDFILYLNRNPFKKILLDLENPNKLKYFQDNYQGLFSSAFIEALFKYKQENKLKLKKSKFFPEISPRHKAILDLDVTEIC